MFFYTILLREEANRLCSTFSRSADCSTPAAVLSKDYVDVFFITLVQRSEDFLQILQSFLLDYEFESFPSAVRHYSSLAFWLLHGCA